MTEPHVTFANPPKNGGETMKDTATIAVCIVGRNASSYIGDALDSLLVQSVPANEVIYYDDGSTDDTLRIVREFEGLLPGLRVIEGGKNVGISAARNRANQLVESDFIAVLDADDILDATAIESYLDFLERNPKVDLAYGNSWIFQGDPESGFVRQYPRFRTAREGIRSVLGAPLLPMKHSSIMYRRETIEALGGYDESFPIKVDIELFLRFLSGGLVVQKIDKTISLHRKHREQVSTRRIGGLSAYRRLVSLYEPNLFVRAGLLSTRVPAEVAKWMIRG